MSKRVHIDEGYSQDQRALRKFTIVQFIKRGRKSARKELDIVPTDWMFFNKKNNRCTVPFPDDLSNPEDQIFLHDLMRGSGDPPEIWKLYNVDIRGRANTYEEALNKLSLLNDVESILTSDSEVTNLKDEMVEQIKKRKLYDQFSKLKETIRDNGAPKEVFKSLKEVEEKTDAIVEEPESDHDPLDVQEPQPDHDLLDVQDTSMLSESSSKVLSEISTNQSTQQEVDIEESTIHTDHSEMLLGEEAAAATNCNLPVLNISNVVCNSEFEAAVLAQLDEINRKLTNMSRRQDEFADFMLDKQITLKVRSTDFLKKYKIKVPIEEQEVFLKFDEQIKINNFLERDVISELNTCIDKDFSVSKSILAMLRAFITKNVAIKYTASRKSTDKENPKAPFKLTNFYTCMQSVLICARSKSNLKADPKELIVALSNVLSNVQSWDRKKN